MSDLHYLPVSLGEALDKLSILDIKLDKITDKRREDVKNEYDKLFTILKKDIDNFALYYNIIKIVNVEIWDMMNDLRDVKEFNDNYMVLCHQCMISNDIRFRIKNKINYISNCSLKEQKGYNIMRLLIDLRNNNIHDEIIFPIKYYSLLYDEVRVITDNPELLKDIFGFDPTIIITKDEMNLKYKKIFDLKNKVFTRESLYTEMEITQKIMDNYFTNF